MFIYFLSEQTHNTIFVFQYFNRKAIIWKTSIIFPKTNTGYKQYIFPKQSEYFSFRHTTPIKKLDR